MFIVAFSVVATLITFTQAFSFTLSSSPVESKLNVGSGVSLESPGTVESLQVLAEVQSPLCDTAPKALAPNAKEIKIGRLFIYCI